jgi:regulator of sirC expression with transglutaminase-like and TPR domain
LDIDSVWPEGHFNATLLYAELKNYDDAIRHMRAYLELVPEAPDAQAARDQMVM